MDQILDFYQGRSGQAYFEWQLAHGELLGRLRARWFVRFSTSEKCVLDFGCGPGFLIANIPAAKRIGVDVNPLARAHVEALGVKFHTSLATVADNSVDLAICNHVLEHVPCPLNTLTELGAKLKKGGQLALSVPIEDWASQTDIFADDSNHHLYQWTPLQLANLLQESGFDVQTAQLWVRGYGFFRGYEKLVGRLPMRVIDFVGDLWAKVRGRREIAIVVSK